MNKRRQKQKQSKAKKTTDEEEARKERCGGKIKEKINNDKWISNGWFSSSSFIVFLI